MWVADLDAPEALTRITDSDAATVSGLNGGSGFVAGNVSLPTAALSRWGLPQTVAGCPRELNKPDEPTSVPTLSAALLSVLGLLLSGFALTRRRAAA
jgi:hypothetical protein